MALWGLRKEKITNQTSGDTECCTLELEEDVVEFVDDDDDRAGTRREKVEVEVIQA